MTLNLYWGDLHAHSSMSYGHGTAEQALARARQQLDFCSVTGHAFWPDMPTDREVYAEIIDYHTKGFANLAKNWEALLKLQEEATGKEVFIAFPSYEWHSCAYGDHNVYSAGPALPLVDAPDVAALREAARKTDALIIPHHIGYTAGYRGINWAAFDAVRSPFVEIFSLHGCSLSEEAPYPMLHDMGPRDFGGTAEAGWQLGHRFGIVGGTDHHSAYPGSHGDGRMGIFASALTREALWEAFAARRVYAATGDRIDARMTVNDAFIGGVVSAPGARRIEIEVHGCDGLDRVELVKNGKVLRRFFAPAEDSAAPPYRLRITWGWGKKSETAQWNGQLSLSTGTITNVETCFSGAAIVSPQKGTGFDAFLDTDLPHEVTERTERTCAWRSMTRGNPTTRHDTTQALSLTIDAPLEATIRLLVNGVRITHTLAELLGKGRAHFMRGWLSEAIRVGPLIPLDACNVTAHFEDTPENEVDVYRLQVAQHNGQWAWTSPIWAEG